MKFRGTSEVDFAQDFFAQDFFSQDFFSQNFSFSLFAQNVCKVIKKGNDSIFSGRKIDPDDRYLALDPFACDIVREVMEITGGVGANAVFNTTAVPALALQAIDAVAQNGTVIMFSSLHPNEPVPVNLGSVHSTQKIITGAQNGSIETFRQAVALLYKGLFDPSALIEAFYDYRDFDKAMACAMQADTYKVVLRIDE